VDNQFSSGPGHQVREAAGLQDQGHLIKAGPANNAAVRIQQVLRAPVDIHRAQEWAAVQ
jgi:hypothetical protein